MNAFHISFTTDNDAFQHDRADEIARVLRTIAHEVAQFGVSSTRHPIRDANGNTIGSYHTEGES